MMTMLILLFAWLPLQQDVPTVEILVRAADGTELAETELLFLLPPENEVVGSCWTGDTGRCRLSLPRGLYGVRISGASLSPLNAQAVGEGGLTDLGITVGNETIRYAFVLAQDGTIYFDAAPDAAIPEPVIPTLEMLHTHAPTPLALQVTAAPSPTATPIPVILTSETATPAPPIWPRLLGLFGIGAGIGLMSVAVQHYGGRRGRVSL